MAFASEKIDKISTVDLIECLSEDHEMPWATYNRGHQITPRQIAGHLKKYDITSKTVRFQLQTLKGYYIGQFQDVFARYLTWICRNSVTNPAMAMEVEHAFFGCAYNSQVTHLKRISTSRRTSNGMLSVTLKSL